MKYELNNKEIKLLEWYCLKGVSLSHIMALTGKLDNETITATAKNIDDLQKLFLKLGLKHAAFDLSLKLLYNSVKRRLND